MCVCGVARAWRAHNEPPLWPLNRSSQSGRLFSTGFVLRHASFYQKIKEILDSGKLGRIVSVEANETLMPAHGGYIMRYIPTLLAKPPRHARWPVDIYMASTQELEASQGSNGPTHPREVLPRHRYIELAPRCVLHGDSPPTTSCLDGSVSHNTHTTSTSTTRHAHQTRPTTDSLPSRVASFAGLDIFIPENKPVRIIATRLLRSLTPFRSVPFPDIPLLA